MEFDTNKIDNEKYIRSGLVTSKLAGYKLERIIGMFLGVTNSFCLLFALKEYETTSQAFAVVCFFIILAIIGFFMYASAKKNTRLLQNANLYVNNFKNDVDGYIKISDLTFYANQSEKTIIENFNLLKKKGYIINCNIEKKRDIYYIVLNNPILKQSMDQNDKLKEVVIQDIIDYNTLKNYKCPTCGASIKVTDINNTICSYCRTRIIFHKKS